MLNKTKRTFTGIRRCYRLVRCDRNRRQGVLVESHRGVRPLPDSSADLWAADGSPAEHFVPLCLTLYVATRTSNPGSQASSGDLSGH